MFEVGIKNTFKIEVRRGRGKEKDCNLSFVKKECSQC